MTYPTLACRLGLTSVETSPPSGRAAAIGPESLMAVGKRFLHKVPIHRGCGAVLAAGAEHVGR